MPIFTILSFIFFTGLVGFLTWRITRGKGDHTANGYFLAGRSLTGSFIAGSLLLTNLSTEQLVGLKKTLVDKIVRLHPSNGQREPVGGEPSIADTGPQR